MSELQRYYACIDIYGRLVHRDDKAGDWVQFDDAKAALAERDEEIARLRKALDEIRKWGGDCKCVRTPCPRCIAAEALETVR